MSMMRCDFCDTYVDTDYDVEGFCDDEKFRCPLCLEDWEAEKELEPVVSEADAAALARGGVEA